MDETAPAGISFTATVGKFATGTGGGYRVVFDIPEIEIENAKRLLELYNKNVQVAVVLLPDGD